MDSKKEINSGDIRFSDLVDELPQALSVYMNQLLYQLKEKGRDITALSLGEAFFSIPKFNFSAIDFDRGYHYSDSQGLPELRKNIAKYYGEVYSVPVDWEKQVLISAGSKIVLFMCMKALLNPGDEVLVQEPAWLSYSEQARICGATIVFIPFSVPVDEMFEKISNRVRLMIINNPNNPAGRVYTRDELLCIYKSCKERNIVLLVDEAYSDYALNENFVSVGLIDPNLENIIIVNSLSKNMGMSGWRIGYMIASDEVIKRVLKLNQHLITCAPTILQLYLATYFEEIIETTKPQILEISKKRKEVKKIMNDLRMISLSGTSTFYFFLDLSSIGFTGDAMTFALHVLLNYDISVVPGGAYGESTKNFIRISIGTEPISSIQDALIVINEQAKIQLDKNQLNRELLRLNLPLFVEN
jgi:aspartate aminotransferase/aminotransferase